MFRREIWLKTLLVTPLVSSLIGLFPSAALATHGPNVNYQYLIATGPLCSLPEPNPCPAIAKADNGGDTVEIAGEGTLSTNPKSVTGGGSFVHKDKDGNVVGSGTWTALKLLTFRGWGPQDDLPPNFEGGRARILVHLVAPGGSEFNAVLKVVCAVGDFPTNAHEGVELNLKGSPNDFTEIVSGLTIFIRQ